MTSKANYEHIVESYSNSNKNCEKKPFHYYQMFETDLFACFSIGS